MKDEVNKIINGDCIEEMKKLTENSIDTIITDPPAGISFMGKSWDSDKGGRDKWIEWLTEVMKECYRVAKPGSTALVWAIPRTSHWTATAIENTGWQIKDIIMHIFGSGFPKSTDISQTLDKQECRKQFEVRIGRSPTKEEFRKEWEGFRKVIGGKKGQGNIPNDRGEWGLKPNTPVDITEPTTPQAKLWNGWGTALKPAAEHWIVAVKPNEGTYANNALKHGVAGLNIDGGRIGTETRINSGGRTGKNPYQSDDKNLNGNNNVKTEVQGRFPANLILDSEAAEMLDEQSGESKSQSGGRSTGRNFGQGDLIGGKDLARTGHNDKGGASRFYKIIEQDDETEKSVSKRFLYQAKASKAERNAGCEGLEEKKIKHGLHSTSFIGDKEYKTNTVGSNNHPTVKPLKLMEYLCTLTKTPTGGIVLDPFAGSGSTCIAAKRTGRPFIGIEKEQEYCKIAEARLRAVQQTLL